MIFIFIDTRFLQKRNEITRSSWPYKVYVSNVQLFQHLHRHIEWLAKNSRKSSRS